MIIQYFISKMPLCNKKYLIFKLVGGTSLLDLIDILNLSKAFEDLPNSILQNYINNGEGIKKDENNLFPYQI